MNDDLQNSMRTLLEKLTVRLEDKPHESRLQRSKVIANWLAAIAIPVVLGVVGFAVNISLKNQETDAKMVELAIGILSEEQTNENKPLRLWAVEVIQKHATVPLNQAAVEALQRYKLPHDIRVKDLDIKSLTQIEPPLDKKGKF